MIKNIFRNRVFKLLAFLLVMFVIIFIYESYKLKQESIQPSLIGIAGKYSNDHIDKIEDGNIYVNQDNNDEIQASIDENKQFSLTVNKETLEPDYYTFIGLNENLNLKELKSDDFIKSSVDSIKNLSTELTSNDSYDQLLTKLDLNFDKSKRTALDLYEIYSNGKGGYYAIHRYTVKEITEKTSLSFIGLIGKAEKPTTHLILANIE